MNIWLSVRFRSLQIDSVGEESLCFDADNINWSWSDDVFHSAEQFRSIKTP